MKKAIALVVAMLAPATATADQLTGQEVFDVLTSDVRNYSGGSVSTFRRDGTFVFTHSGGNREAGTYRITQRGVVMVNDEAGGREYTFVVAERDGTYYFNYGDRLNQGTVYTFE